MPEKKDFDADGKLFCKLYAKTVDHSRQGTLNRHTLSEKHSKVAEKGENAQLMIQTFNDFHINFADAVAVSKDTASYMITSSQILNPVLVHSIHRQCLSHLCI